MSNPQKNNDDLWKEVDEAYDVQPPLTPQELVSKALDAEEEAEWRDPDNAHPATDQLFKEWYAAEEQAGEEPFDWWSVRMGCARERASNQVNNPFIMAGQIDDSDDDEKPSENIDDARAVNGTRRKSVTKRSTSVIVPFDRLPAKRTIGDPPAASPYHTKRAETARQDARRWLPNSLLEEVSSILYGAGLRCHNKHGFADVAMHNALTLTAALYYAQQGLAVVDCHAFYNTGVPSSSQNIKMPRGSGWQERATMDRDEIISFWTGDGEYPAKADVDPYPYAKVNAPRNVGIVFPEDCEVFALDLDGDEGVRALAELEAEHGELPCTWTSISGSGSGRHLLFRTSGLDIRNTANAIREKVDVRGRNGFIIAPPSVHPTGGFYHWAEGRAPGEVPVADAPEWLRDKVYNATKARGSDLGSRPKKAKKSGPTVASRESRASTAVHFEDIIAELGDGDGRRGFDDPINRAAIAWWRREGAEADPQELIEVLREAILTASCDDDRAEQRYAQRDYLEDRIKGARAFVEEQSSGDDPEVMREANRSFEEHAEAFDKDTTEAEVRALFEDAFQHIDLTGRGKLNEVVAKRTNLGKMDAKRIWRELDTAAHKAEKKAQTNKRRESGKMDATADYAVRNLYIAERIRSSDEGAQFFQATERYAMVDEGRGRIRELNYGAFYTELSKVTRFYDVRGDNNTVGVHPPEDSVKFAYNDAALRDSLPDLLAVRSTPFFAADGSRVEAPGYHKGSQVYYAPGGFELPRVSASPSDDELTEAKRLLIQEVLGDFPLGGLGRADIEERCLEGKGEPVPAVANALALMLLPFARALIDGPTPGHIMNKPAPGTGASLLVDVISTIATGGVTPAVVPPKRQEEFAKTLFSSLIDNEPIIFFDNVSHSLNSAELASAMTAPVYRGRILGQSRTAEIAVQSAWVFTANSLTMSHELLRRCILVDLDAKSADPATRDIEWRHPDIRGWVRDNRGQLVWAALTLIQKWVVDGKKSWTGKPLASFENWSRVMGGILNAVGIAGFMGNRNAMADLSDGRDDELTELVQEIADAMRSKGEGARLYANVADPLGKDVGIMNVLNGMDEPLRLNGWKYEDSDGGVEYKNARVVGRRFGLAARRPYRVVMPNPAKGGEDWFYDVSFELKKDDSKTNYYTMTAEAVDAVETSPAE